MFGPHREELLARLPDDAVVLDVGGWAAPFERADWVVDLMPYETRGLYRRAEPRPERFTADTWVVRDICAREPWPFADDQFDFVICAQTLEDIRDPVWVCEEMARVGKAGYVEFPSRLEEHCWGIDGEWPGWNHHRWLCEADRDAQAVAFTFKFAILNLPQFHLPRAVWDGMTPLERIDFLWWEGSFGASERIHLDPPALFAELEAFVAAHRDRVPRRRWRRS
jgi:hypothetical protein